MARVGAQGARRADARFLASLTERSHELKGKTVLYIPDERVEDVDAAAEEKDLVQRLESTVIHWTRQIRDVVNELESSAGEFEEEGPLQELEYWNARAVDLAGIRAQLSEPGMGGIVRVLERVKSVYLPPFLTLWEAINREAAAAEENAKFLSALAEPCGALARAGAKDVAPLLPGILHRVRLIWNTSQNYNVPERICGLLRKISGSLIAEVRGRHRRREDPRRRRGDGGADTPRFHRRRRGVEDQLRLHARGGEQETRGGSRDALGFRGVVAARAVGRFRSAVQGSARGVRGERQFAPTTPLPVFGGSAGPMIAESFKGIQRDFQKLLDALRGLRYRVLDVKATSWPDDFNAFQSGVKDLEVQTQNVMTSAMDGAENLVARVEMLEALRSMAKLDAVVRCVERMTTECFDAFASELAAVKKHFDSNRENPPVDPQLPKHAGAAAWAMTQHARLKRPYDMLKEAATVLPPTPELEALQSSSSAD